MNGSLFYPCCGKADLVIALRAFGSIVSVVHGADPISGVTDGLHRDWELEHIDSALHVFDLEGVAQHDCSIRQVERENLPRGNGLRHSYLLRSRRDHTLSRPFTWHQYDAVEALQQIEGIAVFFFRRDRPTDGEGSSGIRWLDDTLLRRVLAKLQPDGCFVTDGAGMSGDGSQKLLWEAPFQEQPLGLSFSAFGRCFTCVGVFCHTHPKTLVWRVQ
jgi:hypothetical protein